MNKRPESPVAAVKEQPQTPPSSLAVGVLCSAHTQDTLDLIPHTNIPLTSAAAYRFIDTELGTSKLDSIYRRLWYAGVPRKYIKPLHHQRVLSREIVVSERLHLIVGDNAIYVKPIPPCLLHPDFFQEYIVGRPHLEDLALGFLSSYLHLITHESDLHIANELHLFPEVVEWRNWLAFSKSLTDYVGTPEQPRVFKNRYDFGELRLGRLNILVAIQSLTLRGYIPLSTTYQQYLQSFWSIMTVVIFAFLTIALAAFTLVQGNQHQFPAVDSIGLWFSIATLCFLAALIVLPFLWFLALFIDNARFAYTKSRVGTELP